MWFASSSRTYELNGAAGHWVAARVIKKPLDFLQRVIKKPLVIQISGAQALAPGAPRGATNATTKAPRRSSCPAAAPGWFFNDNFQNQSRSAKRTMPGAARLGTERRGTWAHPPTTPVDSKFSRCCTHAAPKNSGFWCSIWCSSFSKISYVRVAYF